MILTEMTRDHVSAVAELEKLCFSSPWSENSIASELDNPLSLWLVAMEGETLVGYIGSQSVMGESDVMNVAVSPEYRRRGIARSLVEELIRRLIEKDCVSLTLEVRTSNFPARSLYETLGFREVGCRKNYYRDPKEDALILRKELLGSC